ncbi:MAG: hypothetical protein HRT90_02370 [Candidatus Margulisbacteria bacterium]|nr:hypothetical protein [Candidatus Margulisiibacteriota bacterium]
MNKKKALMKQKIIIKSVVTPQYKVEKVKEMEKSVASCEKGVTQITDHLKKMGGENRKRLEEECKKIAAQGFVMKQQITKLKNMKDGDHFVENVVEGFTTIQRGDDIRQLMANCSVIVKDNIVQDILESK